MHIRILFFPTRSLCNDYYFKSLCNVVIQINSMCVLGISSPKSLTSDHGPESDEYLCLWPFGLIINDRALVVVCDGCDMQGRGSIISALWVCGCRG